MQKLEPILCLSLFPEVRRGLLELLQGLSREEWTRPTVCAGWSVKDVAAHLLAGELGILARRRDGYTPPDRQPPENWGQLVALINNLNKSWVEAARRFSPRVLGDLVEWAAPQAEEFFASLDPFAPGVPVDWAGPAPAPGWLDIAREYTERWHHQQQIRDAVGRPGLKEKKFFAPVMDTLVRALPHGFRDVAAPDGTVVAVKILGESGREWFLLREARVWGLFLEVTAAPAAGITVEQDDAWRLFTKGLNAQAIRRCVEQEGDPALCAAAIHTISIIG